MEAAYGVGFTLGPLLGEILYDEVGFRDCFFYVSLLLLWPILLIAFLKFEKEDITEVHAVEEEFKKDLTYIKLICNKRTGIALFTLYCCIVCMIFFEPLLTN